MQEYEDMPSEDIQPPLKSEVWIIAKFWLAKWIKNTIQV